MELKNLSHRNFCLSKSECLFAEGPDCVSCHLTVTDALLKLYTLRSIISRYRILSVMSDSCCNMCGAKSDVIVRLQNEVNHLLDVGGCSMHYVRNSVKHACEVIGAIELNG